MECDDLDLSTGTYRRRRGTAYAIVGRQRELDLIAAFLDAAVSDGGALLLSGEPGVGKTVILDAAAERAAGAGTRVLLASGVEFEADVSYSGLNQLALPLAPELDALAGSYRDAISVALGWTRGEAPDRLVVSNAVLALLRQAAAERALLLVVDDVPWLDRHSALVLGFVARRLAGTRLGLIAASRTGVHSFFEAGDIPHHEIGPLDDEAAHDLVRARFPTLAPRVRHRVVAEAQGNPLALVELPAVLSDQQRTAAEILPPLLPLSRRLRNLFVSRLVKLPPATRELLLVAALEETGDLPILQASGRGRRRIEDLAPAERAGLVHVDEGSHRLEFRHPLIRSVTVEVSTSDERRRSHRDLADALEDQPERRAWHLAEAAVEPDERVAAPLEEAAQLALLRGDAVGAVRGLTRAAELSETGAERGRRLAEAAYVGAEVAGRLRNVPEMLSEARRADPELADSLDVAMAASYLLLNGDGDVDTAHRLLVGAIDTQGDRYNAGDGTLIEALHTLVEVCVFGGREELWPPFHALIERFQPPETTPLYLWTKTVADPVRTASAALDRLDAAVASLRDENDPSRVERIAAAGTYVDRITGCRDALERVLRDGRAGGAVTSAIRALAILAFDDFTRGNWDDAQRLVDEAVGLCETHGYRLLVWPSQYTRALLAAARGDYDATRLLTGEMVRWAAPRGAGQVEAYARHARTLAALGQGDYEYAFRQASALSAPGQFASHVPSAPLLVMDLVAAAVHTDRRPQAEAHVRAAREAGIPALSPRLALLTAGAAGIAAAERSAAEAFDDALAVPGSDRWPFDLARVRLAYGERLRRDRAMAASREHLQAAAEAFRRLGAEPWAARAAAELHATGLRRSRQDRSQRASLTPQELEIATLAASGLTNKQIGERLFLSHRTVGAHLYRLFPKLGIKSRAALRDALAEQSSQMTGADDPPAEQLRRSDHETR